ASPDPPGSQHNVTTRSNCNYELKEPLMCYPVPCRVCGKTTWDGCGEHVAEVRAQVPPEQWCPGHPETKRRF
ncbi:hypothetical protein, partial [Mycolicibacter kumamotonensis]|uniref:hypothetical protein n=1 Tax=Mycolicibacter kumamotonensis TaxID=354243 RepID=UPI001A98B691